MNIPEQVEHVRNIAQTLYAEATHLSELTGTRIKELAGLEVGWHAYRKVFSGNRLTLFRKAWLLSRIENAANEVFAHASTLSDISFQRIADLAGCSRATVERLVGPQLRLRLNAVVADSQERLLHAIGRLVEARIPLQEYCWQRVYVEAGHPVPLERQELKRAFADGQQALLQAHEQQQHERIPGATYACIQGDWVNIDEPVWNLSSARRTVRRDRLRPDLAPIVWPILREEAEASDGAAQTLFQHYRDFLLVSVLLGESIPDIRTITLEAIQQVWFTSSLSLNRQRVVRVALERVLERLLLQEAHMTDTHRNRQEYSRVLHWLQTFHLKRSTADNKPYLSETDFDAVLDGCFEDIMQGLAYLQHLEAVGEQLTAVLSVKQAQPVLYWGIALFILVMALTGLRRQSILRLTAEDIARLGPQAFALTWKHGKPNKQRIAVIPALVAEHLQHYIRVTLPIRQHLGTPCIFLARNSLGRWHTLTEKGMETACDTFVRRHTLLRSGEPLRLGSTLLRRTYATRAMYVLPSVTALQAQLGHADARTTLGYVQSDRVEHPAHVDGALDTFGRKVLVRWQAPLLLDDLPDTERQALLGARAAHEQDVGMCRHDRCVKLEEGMLPPCSFCEHLVSGPEYLACWEREKTFREQQLERFSSTSDAAVLYAQMKGQYDRFLANYQYIRARSNA